MRARRIARGDRVEDRLVLREQVRFDLVVVIDQTVRR